MIICLTNFLINSLETASCRGEHDIINALHCSVLFHNSSGGEDDKIEIIHVSTHPLMCLRVLLKMKHNWFSFYICISCEMEKTAGNVADEGDVLKVLGCYGGCCVIQCSYENSENL